MLGQIEWNTNMRLDCPQPDIADSAIYGRDSFAWKDTRRNSLSRVSIFQQTSSTDTIGDLPQPDQADQALQPPDQSCQPSSLCDTSANVNSHSNQSQQKEEERKNFLAIHQVDSDLPPKKRGRGRPRKYPTKENDTENVIQTQPIKMEPPIKRKRGRPRKNPPLEYQQEAFASLLTLSLSAAKFAPIEIPQEESSAESTEWESYSDYEYQRSRKKSRSNTNEWTPGRSLAGSPIKRGRGRPKKKKRGRPRKNLVLEETVESTSTLQWQEQQAQPVKRKRGRPRKYPLEPVENTFAEYESKQVQATNSKMRTLMTSEQERKISPDDEGEAAALDLKSNVLDDNSEEMYPPFLHSSPDM